MTNYKQISKEEAIKLYCKGFKIYTKVKDEFREMVNAHEYASHAPEEQLFYRSNHSSQGGGKEFFLAPLTEKEIRCRALKKVKCKAALGTWYYYKSMPTRYNDYDAPVYFLYDEYGVWQQNFGSHGDMKYFIETGIVI